MGCQHLLIQNGQVYPGYEWLVFGAHFDIAPPVAYTIGAEIGLQVTFATNFFGETTMNIKNLLLSVLA